jgi:hypothetical protein
MKKNSLWNIKFGALLIGLSIIFYTLHYFVFRDLHHIFLYLIGDIAFLFLDVLIVMLVFQRLLEYRDKQLILKKLNMVIGTFFSEIGTDLLQKFSKFDPKIKNFGDILVVDKNWTDIKFNTAKEIIKNYDFKLNSHDCDIQSLKIFLISKRSFLLNLLENQNLLEHEEFTELLWSVFHLTDELAHREDFTKSSEADFQHLSLDMTRAYQYLILQWLEYMKHLKNDYPYLFSLAIRLNPFDENAKVEFK